jgi:hypothetical protein
MEWSSLIDVRKIERQNEELLAEGLSRALLRGLITFCRSLGEE